MPTNTFPKFLWKGKSEALGCNLSVALVVVTDKVMVFAATLFSDDTKAPDEGYLDSFSVEILREVALEHLAEATLVTKLENIYLEVTTQEKEHYSVH